MMANVVAEHGWIRDANHYSLDWKHFRMLNRMSDEQRDWFFAALFAAPSEGWERRHG